MPERIQRRRTKGWRMPGGAVYVGRPTKWGNPWRVDRLIGADIDEPKLYRAVAEITPAVAVELYRGALQGRWRLKAFVGLVDVTTVDVIEELRGKDLVCWCPLSMPCHADVLLELANA